jgi:hypothetical protein
MRPLNKRKGEKGFAIIATTFLLMVMAMIGIALLSMVAGGQAHRMEEVAYTDARYAALGGIEWAKKEIDLGNSAIVTGKTFGSGSFDLTMNPTTYDYTSTGHWGDANVSYTMHTPISGNCLSVDASNVQASGPNIVQIKFKKNCLQKIIITWIQVSWSPNSGEKLKEIQINGTNVYVNNPGVPSGTNLDVTDYTLSDSSNVPVNHFKFSGNLNGRNMTIVWTFKDNTKQITSVFIPN